MKKTDKYLTETPYNELTEEDHTQITQRINEIQTYIQLLIQKCNYQALPYPDLLTYYTWNYTPQLNLRINDIKHEQNRGISITIKLSKQTAEELLEVLKAYIELYNQHTIKEKLLNRERRHYQ